MNFKLDIYPPCSHCNFEDSRHGWLEPFTQVIKETGLEIFVDNFWSITFTISKTNDFRVFLFFLFFFFAASFGTVENRCRLLYRVSFSARHGLQVSPSILVCHMTPLVVMSNVNSQHIDTNDITCTLVLIKCYSQSPLL